MVYGQSVAVMVGSLEFRVLGPLEVVQNGRLLPVVRGKERALLAVLLLQRNTVVPIDSLVEELWNGTPPRTAQTALHGYVGKLRKVLGSERLLTQGSGYLLRVEADELDADRFERMVNEGRTFDALALWRGPALADVHDHSFAQSEIERLNELRLIALERNLETMVESGRAEEAVSKLEALVREQPYREPLRSLLMLALYRAGRQADALAAYRELRRTFVDELGIEPSPEVRSLEQRMLVQDPTLSPQLRASSEPRSAPSREERKVVTVVNCDLVGSADLAHRLDAEAFSALTERFVDACDAVVQRHGGEVAGVTGAAVVCTFGLPRAGEDDALRALRASAELSEELARLGLEARIGVATGELVVGGRLGSVPIGDAANLAARLREDTSPGSVLLDGATYARCRDAVAARPVPLRLTEESDPVDVYELSSATGVAAFRRRLDVPLVGRERELNDLRNAFERTVERRLPCVVTVLGAPGLGKTRLSLEFGSEIAGRARVLTGHCVSYGSETARGLLKELVVAAFGAVEPRERIEEALAGDPEGPALATTLLTASGLVDGAATQQETRWSFQRVIRRLAATTPLVILVEDAHWADDAFLDLLEHVLDLGADVPLMVVCLARPEFADEHAAWLGRRQNATSLRLEPLTELEARAHVDHLGHDVAADVRARVVELAAGNALFAEQLLSHAIEQGGRVEAPPTIEALLAARIDGLGKAERTVLDAASVVGEEFTLVAVQALVPDELTDAVPQAVMGVVRRDLVRPEGSTSTESFRFSHSLVRDAAYAALLKRARADLHERFAAWLERRPLGQEALIGHHLELAYRALTDVGGDEGRREELAARAAESFGASTSAVLGRGDFVNAEAYTTRGLALVGPSDRQRPELMIMLGRALAGQRRGEEAFRTFAESRATARRLGDASAERRAELHIMQLRLWGEPALDMEDIEEMEAVARDAVDAFEATGDVCGSHAAWVAVQTLLYAQGRYGDAIQAVERAIALGRELGDLDTRLLARPMLFHLYGPTPSSLGIAHAHRLLANDIGLAGTADTLAYGGVLQAMRGDPEEGRGWVRQSQELWRQAGADGGGWFGEESMVNLLADDWPAAESSLRAQCELLDRPGLETTFATYASALAAVLIELGRDAEADAWADDSRQRGAAFEAPVQAGWRSTRARVLVRRGSFDEAVTLARDAVALARKADDLWARGDAELALVEVHALAGRTDDAVAAANAALRSYEAKEHLVGVARAGKALVELGRG